MNFASFCEVEPFSGFIPFSNGGEHKKTVILFPSVSSSSWESI